MCDCSESTLPTDTSMTSSSNDVSQYDCDAAAGDAVAIDDDDAYFVVDASSGDELWWQWQGDWLSYNNGRHS